MQCIAPITVTQPQGRVHVPCGVCMICLSNKRTDWSIRLNEELRISHSAHFITLTYTEEQYELLNKRRIQLFLKRLRKYQDSIEPDYQQLEKTPLKWPKIKYFAVGEYGTQTSRAHYHIIMYNLQPKTAEQILDIWGQGQVMVVPATPAGIHYTTKYLINKNDSKDHSNPPFQLSSKKLGLNYIKRNGQSHIDTKNDMMKSDGINVRMPRYYRDKLFGVMSKDEQKQKRLEKIRENYEIRVKQAAKYHSNPEMYIEEKRRYFNENAKTKINKTNKL